MIVVFHTGSRDPGSGNNHNAFCGCAHADTPPTPYNHELACNVRERQCPHPASKANSGSTHHRRQVENMCFFNQQSCLTSLRSCRHDGSLHHACVPAHLALLARCGCHLSLTHTLSYGGTHSSLLLPRRCDPTTGPCRPLGHPAQRLRKGGTLDRCFSHSRLRGRCDNGRCAPLCPMQLL